MNKFLKSLTSTTWGTHGDYTLRYTLNQSTYLLIFTRKRSIARRVGVFLRSLPFIMYSCFVMFCLGALPCYFLWKNEITLNSVREGGRGGRKGRGMYCRRNGEPVGYLQKKDENSFRSSEVPAWWLYILLISVKF